MSQVIKQVVPGDIVFTGDGREDTDQKLSLIVPSSFWDTVVSEETKKQLKEVQGTSSLGFSHVTAQVCGHSFSGAGYEFRYLFLQANMVHRIASIYNDEEMKEFNRWAILFGRVTDGYIDAFGCRMYIYREHMFPEPNFCDDDLTGIIQALYDWHQANVLVSA